MAPPPLSVPGVAPPPPPVLQRSPHSTSRFPRPPSLPRRRRGLIIISQARPHQETWLLMREKSIRLFLSSLSLPASIYPLPPPSNTHTHTHAHTNPSDPPPPFFLIRQIPRELGAISAAGTGVMCVFVCLRDLGAC